MADVTVVATGEGEETPPSPVEEAVAAVEVLAAAHEAGVAEGVQDGLLLASMSAMQGRIDALEGASSEVVAALGVASEAIAAQARAIDELNTRLSQEQTAHAEVVEEVIEPETTEEEITEPVVDKTPSRKRHWT